MTVLGIAALGALSALWLMIAAARRLRRRRVASGLIVAGAAVVLLCAAMLAALAAAGLRGFRRLAAEQTAGTIAFRRVGPQDFTAQLTLADGSQATFRLRGDEWQVDARLLKWRPLASVLGFDAAYRMERISGRYERIEDERRAPRTVYALARPSRIDLWELARRYGRWLPGVDALYGSATYTPMADGAVYEIDVSQSGLLARPRNQAARDAIGGWR